MNCAKECTTCHFACDCREAKFKELAEDYVLMSEGRDIWKRTAESFQIQLKEQCHVNAMGAERELKLMKEIEFLKKQNAMLLGAR